VLLVNSSMDFNQAPFGGGALYVMPLCGGYPYCNDQALCNSVHCFKTVNISLVNSSMSNNAVTQESKGATGRLSNELAAYRGDSAMLLGRRLSLPN
jgi:hypothetical protein